jgi:hypothetical protein
VSFVNVSRNRHDIDLAEDMRTLFCPRCYVFDCSLHGPNVSPQPPPRSDPTVPLPPSGSFLFPILAPLQPHHRQDEEEDEDEDGHDHHRNGKTKRGKHRESKHKHKRMRIESSKICGPDCCNRTLASTSFPSNSTSSATSKPSIAPPRSWAPNEHKLMVSLLNIFGENFCLVSRILGRCSCAELQHYCAANAASIDERIAALRSQADEDGGALLKKTLSKLQAIREKRRKGQIPVTAHYEPCYCVGGCTEQCPCVQKANFCEKYCYCSSEHCQNKFKGCKCGGDADEEEDEEDEMCCKTQECPCWRYGRECDPDICSSCGADARPDVRPLGRCNNTAILYGMSNKVRYRGE